jgi:hypothetical protein
MDMSPESVAQEDDEGEGENAVTTAGCFVAMLLQEAVTREAEGENNCVHLHKHKWP